MPSELEEKVLGKPEVEGKDLSIENHVVRRTVRVRKKRFEL